VADRRDRLLLGPYEKIMNAIFELWSRVMPERALACSFNLEYLLVGGRDARRESGRLHVVRLDGRRLGRPQRQGRLERDRAGLRRRARGAAARGPGAALPGAHTGHEIRPTPAGPGASAAAAASRRAAADRGASTVMSYCCDRARSITWGIEGGLPVVPHGVWLNAADDERFLGAVFSNVPSARATSSRARRPAAAASAIRSSATRRGARGRRRRLRQRRAARARLRRRRREVDAELASTRSTRARRGASATDRAARAAWLAEDASRSRERYRAGELGRARPRPPLRRDRRLGRRDAAAEDDATFREMLQRRSAAHWAT
jgi:N-methylhydantoinase B